MLIHLSNENFNDLISKGKVIVDFYAQWCGPCKMLGPVIEKVSNKHSDITFIKVDIDMFNDLAIKYTIMSVPTVLKFENGTIVDKHIGFISEVDLESFIK